MKYTPSGLWREAQAAIEKNDKRLAVYDDLRTGFATPFWDGWSETNNENSEGYDPENHAYEFVSYAVPQLIGGDPEYMLRSRNLAPDDPAHDEVRAQRFALNQWVMDTRLRDVAELCAMDMMFAFGAAIMTPTRTALTYQQASIPVEWPQAQRISPRNFLRDPLATCYEECRFLGHRTVVAFEELEDLAKSDTDEGEGWDMDAIDRLKGEATSTAYRAPGGTAHGGERDEVELIELWVPSYNLDEDEYTEDEGFHGTIFTIAVVKATENGATASPNQPRDASEFVRAPRPYYGARGGPYVHAGAMRVPDDPWALAPLVATEGQARELNAYLRTQSRDLRTWKRQLFVRADDANIANAIKAGEHNLVVPIQGLATAPIRDFLQTVEVGGPSDALAYAVAEAHSRLRRNAGLGEAQTGQAPGSGTTATAVAVASQDAATRMERLKEVFRRFLEEIGRRALFYIATSKDIEITLDERAAQEFAPGAGGVTVTGGQLGPKEVEELHVEIDVISVERTSEQVVQARMMQGVQLALEAIPYALQVPYKPFWSELFEMVGDTLNVPGMGRLGDKMVDGALAVVMQQQQQLQQQSQQTAPNVRLGRGGGPAAPAARPQQPAAFGPQGTGNKTPGMPSGVQQPTPLAGAQRQGGRV